MAERDGALDQLRQAFAHTEQLAGERQTEIQRYAAASADAQVILAERNGALDQLRQAFAQAERVAIERNDELASSQIAVNRLEHKCLELTQRLSTIENSFGWRLLKPFRNLNKGSNPRVK